MSLDTQWRQRLQLSASSYILVLLTVAAATLRLIFLNSKSIWLDEAMSASLAAGTLKSHIRSLLSVEVNMALYYVTLHLWSHLAGLSEISLRLPSVIFATATVPLIYALGTELCDRRVGLMAALLLCVNVSCIQYAQSARSYAMTAMLVTLSSLIFVRSIKSVSLARYASYLIAGPLCAYAHLFGILMLPTQWLSLFLFRVNRKTRVRLRACVAVVAILSLPAVILVMHGDYGQVSWIPASSALEVISLFARFAGIYWGVLRGSNWALFTLYLAAIVIALAGASERERPVVVFLLLSVLLPVAIALAVSIFKPIFQAHYLLIYLPFFVLLAAIGVMRIKSPAVMVATTVLMVALSLFQDRDFYNGGPMQDWRGAINFIAANAKRGDVLAIFPKYDLLPADYYVGHLAHPAFRVISGDLPTRDDTGRPSTDQTGNLQRFLAANGVNSFTRVWIATDMGHSNAPTIRALEAGHQVAAGPDLKGVFLVRID